MVKEMAYKKEILLTAADLLKWREEDRQLDDEIRKLELRRKDIRRKIDAAEVFAAPVDPVESPSPPQASSHDSDEPSDSIPTVLCESLSKTGDVLNVQGIKARLIELGFGEKLKTQPNYHYSLVYRLSKSGRLVKRGLKYRAPPVPSPEGAAEAVGASASH
jgi:hypothetical protein